MLAPPPLPRTLAAALRDLASAKGTTRASAIGDLVRHALLSDSVRAEALPKIQAVLKDDPEAEPRGAAAVALGDLKGDCALPALLVAIEDTSPYVRQMALNALGEIGDPRAAPRLSRALSDARPEVRYQAIIAYAKLAAAEDAADAIARALADADEAVRYIALRLAEERLDADGALDPRWTAVARAMLEDGTPHLKLVAAIFLAKAKDDAPRAKRVLEEVVRDGRVDGKLAEKEDEREAVEMAGRLDLRDATPALERRAWGLASFVKDTCAWHAKIALARMGNARARAEIVRDLASRQSEVRAAAIVAAGRGRVVEARGALESVREAHGALVAEALAELDRDH